MEMCHNEEEKTFDTDRGHLLCSSRFSILVLSRSSVGRVCCGGVVEVGYDVVHFAHQTSLQAPDSGDVVAFERFIGCVTAPRKVIRVDRVSMGDTWTAKTTEETRTSMIMDKFNLAKELGDSLMP